MKKFKMGMDGQSGLKQLKRKAPWKAILHWQFERFHATGIQLYISNSQDDKYHVILSSIT
jgi:hypothetical protein